MELLKQRIIRDGKLKPGGIVKVDSFLNHQIDPELAYEMALELKRRYAGEEINKVLTIEASGIAMGIMTAYVFGCPLVFAKKTRSRNISDELYTAEVESFTHGNTNTVIVSKEYLSAGDKVLIVDDFLAMGAALQGLKSLVEKAGGQVVGAGIAIEKAFQPGGEQLRRDGMRIESLARIASIDDDGSISFC